MIHSLDAKGREKSMWDNMVVRQAYEIGMMLLKEKKCDMT